MNKNVRIDLNDLLILMQVVEYGGYSAASRALGMPKSTISQRVAALERAVGTGLLRRTSRSHSLTDAGKLLLPFAQVIDRQAKEAEHAILNLGVGVTGTLRLSCSVAVAQFALAPILPKFFRDQPLVDLRVDATNRYVDLIGEGYDMGLRAHGTTLKDSSLRQRVVARTPWSLAVSPAWLSQQPVPSAPEQLSSVPTVYFRTNDSDAVWTMRNGETEIKVPLKPRLWSDDMALLRSAAISAIGIVALPTYILGPAMRDGLLVPVLPGWTTLVSSISALSPPKSQSSPLAKVFSDFLAVELDASLESWTRK